MLETCRGDQWVQNGAEVDQTCVANGQFGNFTVETLGAVVPAAVGKHMAASSLVVMQNLVQNRYG